MISGSELLDAIEAKFGRVRRSFAFPFTHIAVQFDGFPADEDERELFLATRLGVDLGFLRATANRLFLRFHLYRPGEPNELPADRGEFWMRALQEHEPSLVTAQQRKIVHFYGFKGGQGRSSSLATLAMALANDGWRVLAVDMDAEAPSLHTLFASAINDVNSTMIGLRAGVSVRPFRAYNSPSSDSFVDLLAFRPSESRWNLDAAALAMEVAVYPPGQVALIDGLRRLANENGYDIVLIDHRTGLAPTVLPWTRGLPGSVVAFARMDGQWRAARGHFSPLWSTATGQAAVLASAMPPARDDNDYAREVDDQASELLDELASAVLPGADFDHEVNPDDLRDYWVLWPFDSAFTSDRSPRPSELSGATLVAISKLRRLLQLSERRLRPLHVSGASDEGHLVQTLALRTLRLPTNPYAFIVGRKGTGKTRLVRALAAEGLGEPLFVADDFSAVLGGINRDASFDQAVNRFSQQAERFWWHLLAAGLRAGPRRSDLKEYFSRAVLLDNDPIDDCREAVRTQAGVRTFLVDGLETGFSRERMFDFVGALFRLVTSIENDPVFRDGVRIKVFVRTDLAERGYENFEQFSVGRRLDLQWDTQSILNFALTRIAELPWFFEKFPVATEEVRRHLSKLTLGALPVNECDALLLRFLPERLGHANINTTTFLRTWFSDDPKAEASFYPRVYDEFLGFIAAGHSAFSGPELKNGHLAQDLLYRAHAHATQHFLTAVQSELRNIVDLEVQQLDDLITAMKGTITPFSLEQRVTELAELTGLGKSRIRSAMERMKRIGIFEDRPGFTGQWRVGRLFKTSLGMLYDRRKRKREPGELPGDS